MAIYRRGDSIYYWMKFKVETPQGVVSVCKSTGTQDKKLALEIYESARTDALRGKHFGAKSAVTVAEIVDIYLRRCKHQPSYQGRVAHLNHVKAFFKKKLARDVKPGDILDYQNLRLTQGAKASTINRELSPLRTAFYMAISSGEHNLTENPVKSGRHSVVKFFSERKFRRDRFLSAEEKARLFPAIAEAPEYGPYLLKIVIFAIQTGLRQGEIRHLKWDDINMKQERIRVEAGMEDKTRFVPMFHEVKALLASLPRRGAHVFTDEAGRKLSRYGFIVTGLERACRLAGIKNLHFHDLRHTFASDLVMAGVDMKTIAEYMGHSVISMTERYSHLSPTFKAAQINLLPSALRYAEVTAGKNGNEKTIKTNENHIFGQLAQRESTRLTREDSPSGNLPSL